MPITEQKLEKLVLNNLKFDQIAEALDVFCPFEAIGMERQEIRHGHFLYYVLNPQRPHGFGTECLRHFMWAVATSLSERDVSVVRPLDVHLMNLDSAIVDREYKSIDLLIMIPGNKVVLAIELKIDSTEHSGQLGRYRATIEKDFPTEDGWQHVLLFLTKRGESPSKQDGKHWHTVALETVANSFDHVVKKGTGSNDARIMLSAYIGMLRRKHLTDSRMEELARALWREHKDALDFLMARRPDFSGEIFSLLLERQQVIATQLSNACDIGIVKDHSSKTYLRFAITDWDSVPGMLSGTGWKPSSRMMLFEVFRGQNGAVKCYFALGPGASPHRENLFQALKDRGANVGGSWELAPKWRHMESKQLTKLEDGQDPEEQIELITDGIKKFLVDQLPAYRAAMANLIHSHEV